MWPCMLLTGKVCNLKIWRFGDLKMLIKKIYLLTYVSLDGLFSS